MRLATAGAQSCGHDCARAAPHPGAPAEQPPPPLSAGSGVSYCLPEGSPGGVPNSIINMTAAPVPTITHPPQRVRFSYLNPRMLVHQAGVQGTVVVQGNIDRDGRILEARALSGHPLLVAAAIDAVRQWRYRPCLLNGEPVEVDTQVTVTLAGAPVSSAPELLYVEINRDVRSAIERA